MAIEQVKQIKKESPKFYQWLIEEKDFTDKEIGGLTQKEVTTKGREYRGWKKRQEKKYVGKIPGEPKPYFKKTKPFKGSDITVDELAIKQPASIPPFERRHKKNKIFLNGQWRDEDEVKKWQYDNVSKWSKPKIKQLQAELGYKELTGDYTSEVKEKHLAALRERSKIGLERSREQLNRNVIAYNEQASEKEKDYIPTGDLQYLKGLNVDPNKKYSEKELRKFALYAEKQKNLSYVDPSYLSDKDLLTPGSSAQTQKYGEADLRAKQIEASALDRKKTIMNEVSQWYEESTSYKITDPTSPLYGKVSQKDLLGKYLGGWDYDNYYYWARNRPEIKQRYPGLNDDLTIIEYNQARTLAQTTAIQELGYPLSKTQLEIAIKMGELPKAGMSTGSPLIGGQ